MILIYFVLFVKITSDRSYTKHAIIRLNLKTLDNKISKVDQKRRKYESDRKLNMAILIHNEEVDIEKIYFEHKEDEKESNEAINILMEDLKIKNMKQEQKFEESTKHEIDYIKKKIKLKDQYIERFIIARRKLAYKFALMENIFTKKYYHYEKRLKDLVLDINRKIHLATISANDLKYTIDLLSQNEIFYQPDKFRYMLESYMNLSRAATIDEILIWIEYMPYYKEMINKLKECGLMKKDEIIRNISNNTLKFIIERIYENISTIWESSEPYYSINILSFNCDHIEPFYDQKKCFIYKYLIQAISNENDEIDYILDYSKHFNLF